jgi:hypothetical protein
MRIPDVKSISTFIPGLPGNNFAREWQKLKSSDELTIILLVP